MTFDPGASLQGRSLATMRPTLDYVRANCSSLISNTDQFQPSIPLVAAPTAVPALGPLSGAALATLLAVIGAQRAARNRRPRL
jgi:hypothetical protein